MMAIAIYHACPKFESLSRRPLQCFDDYQAWGFWKYRDGNRASGGSDCPSPGTDGPPFQDHHISLAGLEVNQLENTIVLLVSAVRHIIECLCATYKIELVEAYILYICSVAGDLRLHEVVRPRRS